MFGETMHSFFNTPFFSTPVTPEETNMVFSLNVPSGNQPWQWKMNHLCDVPTKTSIPSGCSIAMFDDTRGYLGPNSL